MKKILMLWICTLVISMNLNAQTDTDTGYVFTVVKKVPYTSIKNQNRSGTCWAFSGLGFLESELMRLGKGEHDLSAMFIANNAYKHKADMYVRMYGSFNFSAGGAFHDVVNMIKYHGIVPTEVYSGINYGEDVHTHAEMDGILKAIVDVVVKKPNKKISTAWKNAYSAVIDAYLGKIPEEFTYQGKKYTPQTFFKSLDFNLEDYVSLTSFTHHPFYEKFILEVSDNWMLETVYNLPLDELMQVMYNAVQNGFPIAWASDVSDKGFNSKKGIAIIPDKTFTETDGSDRARWEKLSQGDKEKELYSFEKPGQEKTITQEMRQIAFDNQSTTDDHGMIIVGLAKDQAGTNYFIVKNSWGDYGPYNGIFYASDSFVKLQTMDIMVHKDAIPKDIRKKLGIK